MPTGVFIVFFCDLFFSHESNCFTNYVDDTIPYANGNNPEKTLFKIQDFTQKLSPLTKLKLFFLIKSHMFLCTIEALNFQISATVIKVLFLFITLICQTALSFLNF